MIFAVTATAAIASGSGQEEGVTPYTTFPSNNTFFYDEPQEDMSPICRADFSDNEGSSSNAPMKYLADYNFLCELKLPCFEPSIVLSFLIELFCPNPIYSNHSILQG